MNAHFTKPGDYSFPLGLTLEVLDRCDSSYFPTAPLIEKYDDYYFGGNVELVLGVTWDEDTTSADYDYSCGGYSIEVAYNSELSNIDSGSINFALNTYEVVDLSTLKFVFS
mgnify:CR=1 FL=1